MLTIFLLYFLFPSTDTVICPCSGGQGVQGTVYVVSGNQMPSPRVKRSPLKGVRSTVYIYELTPLSRVVRQGQSAYYSAVQTPLVKQVETDSLGHFCTCLPVGRYSLFTKKNGFFYANLFDATNNIAPVEVVKGQMSTLDCHIEGDRPPVY